MLVRLPLVAFLLLVPTWLPIMPDNAEPALDLAATERGAGSTWSAGSWWRIQLRTVTSGTTTEATLIVGQRSTHGATIGVDDDAHLAPLLGSGIVPVGLLHTGDLSFEMYGEKFRPIDVPLVVGKQWTTSIGALSVEATVKEQLDSRIRIEFVVPRERTTVLTVIYDEKANFFQSIEKPGHAAWSVVERGERWAGAVVIPQGVHLAIRSNFELGPTRLAGKLVPPYTQTEVAGDWNRLVLSMRVDARDIGDYLVEAQPPSGAPFQIRKALGAPPKATEANYLVTDPAGPWSIRLVAAGNGTASVHGWAYREHVANVAHAVPVQAVDAAVATHEGGDAGGWIATGVAAGLVLLGLRLFSRLRRHVLQDHATRDRVLELIRQQPGITAKILGRVLEVPRGTLEYHLRILEAHGLIGHAKVGRMRGWYVSGSLPRGAAISNLVAQARPLRRILEEISLHPGIHSSALARRLEVHHSTIAFHVRRLETAGALEVKKEGRRRRLFALRTL